MKSGDWASGREPTTRRASASEPPLWKSIKEKSCVAVVTQDDSRGDFDDCDEERGLGERARADN